MQRPKPVPPLTTAQVNALFEYLLDANNAASDPKERKAIERLFTQIVAVNATLEATYEAIGVTTK